MNNIEKFEWAKAETYKKVYINELINFDKEPRNPVKVSIVIPVCNAERYLRECLDSAVNQTIADIEIICVNDGSDDNSLEILKEYASKDFRVKIIDKNNAGYGHTMNIGIDRARGEYIGIIESDDYALAEMYETLYNVAVENNLDFVKSDFYRFYGEGEDLSKEYNKIARDDSNYGVLIDPSKEQYAFQFIMNTWSGLYKASFLRENVIRHNETPGASFQDNGFWFKNNVFGKRTMIVNQAFYMNRRDNPDSSVYNKQKVYCGNIEYDLIYKFLKEEGIFDNFSEVYTFKRFHTCKFTINRIAQELRKDYIRYISEEFNDMESNGELVSRYLSNADWNMIHWIMRDPDEYYYVGLNDEIVVSVILPVYNVAPYLDECLKSIEQQTLRKIEIICVNDGSTDESLEIIKRHQNKDHRIRIVTQENHGAGTARNVGMKLARGKYLSFLDADDWIDKDTYSHAVAKAENLDADIVIYRAYLYENTTGKETKNNYSVKISKLPEKVVFSRYDISSNLFSSIMGWAWDKLYRATFIFNSGLQFQAQRTTNDLFFVYASLLKAPRITVLDEYLYHQRRNVGTSLSNSREKSWSCFYNALTELRKELKKMGIYEKYEQDFVNYALHSCMWNFNTLKEPNAEALFHQLRNSWFEELGINGREADYFEDKKLYEQYLEIIELPLEDWKAYIQYRTNSILKQNDYASSGQKIIVSNTEILTVEQIIEKLEWNRNKLAELEKQKYHNELSIRNYELQEIRKSFSYKLGHTLTFPVRWLRYLILKIPM